ncbi:tryptophan synthase beta subunit-like PLP-dependent enzyme [Kalaharituber pfeilii]|nr:tryptophan synthase beta subunit-like PLP-dependent enzyme [Kalaharituber pfeilii]
MDHLANHHSQLLLVTAGLLAGALLTLAAQRHILHGPPRPKPARKPAVTGVPPGDDDEDEMLAEDIRNGIEECIGNTPLFRIKSLSEATGCDILGKAERWILQVSRAGGSVKDRVALNMIKTAEAKGLLRPYSGDVVYEGTVGSTGFVNRARILSETHASLPDSVLGSRGFFADQFESDANFLAHYTSTGPEIYRQCGGRLDAFVAGAGTGVVLADPPGSGLYNRVKYGVMFDIKEKEGTRRRQQVDTIVEGIGINRVTANFEAGRRLIDDAVRVQDEEAMAMARFLVEKDGLFLGSSSSVNSRPGHRIVTILCDHGTRHLSKFWANMNVGAAWDMTIEDVLNAGKDQAYMEGARHAREDVPIELKSEEYSA